MNRVRNPIAVVALLAVAIVTVVLATSGGTAKSQPKAASGSALSLKSTSLGKSLVDANGRTLYLFAADGRNVSRLSPAGRAIWPPFTAASRPGALAGISAAAIGRVSGAGGSAQVTYNGHPLYYYAGDQKPGQTLGEGLDQFGARWYVLSSNGAAVTSAPAVAIPMPATNAGSYGSGY